MDILKYLLWENLKVFNRALCNVNDSRYSLGNTEKNVFNRALCNVNKAPHNFIT